MCHVSLVTCHYFFLLLFSDKVVKLVDGGCLFNGATPSSLGLNGASWRSISWRWPQIFDLSWYIHRNICGRLLTQNTSLGLQIRLPQWQFNLRIIIIHRNHLICTDFQSVHCVKQAQPKMCHSPKVEGGVENQFFTSWTYFLDNMFWETLNLNS